MRQYSTLNINSSFDTLVAKFTIIYYRYQVERGETESVLCPIYLNTPSEIVIGNSKISNYKASNQYTSQTPTAYGVQKKKSLEWGKSTSMKIPTDCIF